MENRTRTITKLLPALLLATVGLTGCATLNRWIRPTSSYTKSIKVWSTFRPSSPPWKRRQTALPQLLPVAACWAVRSTHQAQ
jgi:hypothetical protein